jgi:hypothetical protein
MACKLYVPRRGKESDIKATFEKEKSEVKTKFALTAMVL